ncbi:sulfatase [Labilibaculum filiforme]|uniref:Sulfatase n=1 Tax=Labilibaculum filiforme TaxID=1940526 RepID=A0A2N3HTH7_9BACT|nr:sulfatase [Labilibaculum filiforme]
MCSTIISAVSCSESVQEKPNIIFILADDLGYADVGFNGSKYYETPALDNLAKQSLILDQSYMYPTCSPSRTAIFTGQQSFRTGVYTVPVLESGTDQENIFSRWTVGKDFPIYAEPLAKAGYKSIHLGKWHIVGPYPEEELAKTFPLTEKLTQPEPGDYSWVAKHKTDEIKQFYPEGRGFMKNVGGTFRGDPAFEEGGYKSETGGYRAPFSNPFIEAKADDEWLTDRLTSDAIEFMDQNKKGPFFVNLDFYAVHRPIKSRNPELYEKYINKEGDTITGQGIGKYKEIMAGYATMVESLDQNVQRIVDYLDKNDLRKNTIIIFSSDNGYNGRQSSNNLMRGSKGYIYEGGIRVPGLINWPGKVVARRTSEPVTLLDYFPTFLKLAGINDFKGQLDGNSMTDLFEKDCDLFADRPLFWQLSSVYKHGTCSVIRKKQYKLIQFLATGELELYDLLKDPMESYNLASENPDLANELLSELVAWRKANQVPLPPNSVVSN